MLRELFDQTTRRRLVLSAAVVSMAMPTYYLPTYYLWEGKILPYRLPFAALASTVHYVRHH